MARTINWHKRLQKNVRDYFKALHAFSENSDSKLQHRLYEDFIQKEKILKLHANWRNDHAD